MKRTIVICTAIAMGSLVAACSASSTTNTPTPTAATANTPTPTATPVPSTPTPTPTPAPTTVDLSGTWTGSYSGPFNGTFTLAWLQSGSALHGTIQLSRPADNLHISGNVSGSGISFGAVGVVTYSGTVSGNSMSGSYVDVANGQTGSWSGNKS
ncbi:MAG TPA: hypothetical protein VMU65_11345 [Candidatus Saccharimonadales bacterium]|nr:hypothetical protein [Candidatus Saccharimonadales bacterium]